MARKAAKPRKMAKKSSEKLKNAKTHKTPPETDSQCKLSPLDWHYHVSSLNHPISKSSTNFVHIFSLFGNELMKHNPREARDAMLEIKIRVLRKVYKHVFKQLYTTIMPRLARTSVNPH
jgi:hypothetical protein